MDLRTQNSGMRALPQVQRLLESDAAQRALARVSRARLTAALREALEDARRVIGSGGACPAPGELIAAAVGKLDKADGPVLRRVINATGIIVHTNLGRAPLPQAALAAMAEVGAGYANLEFELEAGARGQRTQGIEPLLCELTGAEAALAVNNAAAAVLLALSALADGGEVIVSRGELVEIGGGFRIPEVIAQGGARLVEVGTTNKTRLSDYRSAITERTRVLLKVHQSNYRVIGFTAEASLTELSGLARDRGLLLMHDLGSGAMLDLALLGRPSEPTARESLAAGADLVAFSGDKLMGGPQGGLLVGQRAALAPLRDHPLLRAVRLDKTTLAALEATLRLYRDPTAAGREVPVLRMLSQSVEALQRRAERLLAQLDGGAVQAELRPSRGYVGGGALPGECVDSRAVVLRPAGASVEQLASALRRASPPVVGRIAEDRVWLDMLTVEDAEVGAVAHAIREACGSPA